MYDASILYVIHRNMARYSSKWSRGPVYRDGFDGIAVGDE
jgi:hypothetical protein